MRQLDEFAQSEFKYGNPVNDDEEVDAVQQSE